MASVLAAMMIWCRSGLNMSVLVGLSRRARVARGVVPHRISGCGSVLLSGFSLAEQKRESKRGISELLEAFAPDSLCPSGTCVPARRFYASAGHDRPATTC